MKLLFFDYTDGRTKEIEAICASAKICHETYKYAKTANQDLIEPNLFTILAYHKGNLVDCGDDERNAISAIKEFYDNSSSKVLKIKHSGDFAGAKYVDGEIQCSFSWLKNNLKSLFILLEKELNNNVQVNIEKFLESFINLKDLPIYLFAFGFLLENYLLVKALGEKKPGEVPPNISIDQINNTVCQEHYNVIKEYPCRWFWECRDDVGKLFNNNMFEEYIKRIGLDTPKGLSVKKNFESIQDICNKILECPAQCNDSTKISVTCPDDSHICNKVCCSENRLFDNYAYLKQAKESYIKICQLL